MLMDNGFDEHEIQSEIKTIYGSKLRIKLRSLWLGFIFYFRFSQKEIKRHLFNFILGICSCTITVFVAATISTIVDNAPFVILKQAENSCGQYDIQITPRSYQRGPYLNFSLITDTLSKYSQHEIAELSSYRYLFNGTQSLFFTPKCYNINVNNMNLSDLSNFRELYHSNDCKPIFMDRTRCKAHLSSLWIIDFEQEKRMGFGRNFNPQYIPKRGEIIINKKQMKAFDIEIGDYLLLLIDLQHDQQQNLLYSIIKNHDTYNKKARHIADSLYCSRILFPVRVIAILDEISFGKFGSNINKYTFIMNNKYFVPYISLYRNNKLLSNKTILSSSLQSINLMHLSTHIFFNIPSRIKYYLTLNYAKIQNEFAIYTSILMYFLGFTQLEISTPIEIEFYKLRFAALFFELVLDIILLTLVLLSVMLLYSLLTISVENRIKIFSILRMIGMKKSQLLKLIINQSLTYSFPSFIIAIILSQISIYCVLYKFSHLIQINLSPIITVNGFCRAIFVAFFIPLISSILPIKNALNCYVATNKNNNNILKYKIERSEQSKISSTFLLIGIIMVFFGFCIYYLFPLSLITQRLSLLLTMFFIMLIVMLIGLLLLSFNIEYIIEKCIILLLFAWWERKHLTYIVYKNIIAHKHRNKKTTLMYSLSLGFIIMISVVYRVNINAIGLRILTKYGAKYAVSFTHNDNNNNNINHYQEIQNKFNKTIETITFRWKAVKYNNANMYDLSKMHKTNFLNAIISPDYMDVAETALFSPSSSSMHRIDHQLYSAKGSQSAIIGHSLTNKLFLNKYNKYNKKLIIEFNYFDSYKYKIIKTLQFINVLPGYDELSKSIHSNQASVGLSIPSTLRLNINIFESVEDALFEPRGILIKFYANASILAINGVKEYINEYADESFDYNDFMVIMKSTNDIMDIVFSAATYISLFLCLFSIISSMYINIYEQSKEIAILRAIGLNKWQTYKVYAYEAIILILSSCFMGVTIGALVGFTMTAQIALYASYPIGFSMPYQLLIIILIASFISAFLSVILPLIQLLSNTVSHIMRLNF